MALGEATKKEIRLAVQEAFSSVEIPSPEGCAIERERMAALEVTVQKHDEFIDGNGKEGAKTTIPLIELTVNKLAKDFYEFRGKIEGRTWAITLLALGTLITSILNLVLKAP